MKATATQAAVVRAGPGATHTRVATHAVGSATWYAIVGRDAVPAGWWQIQYSATVTGWVPAGSVQTRGHTDEVRVTWVLQAVRGLTATAAGLRALTVRWQAPASGPAPTGYAVQYRRSAVAGTGTTATIPNLTPNTAYDVQVQATRGAPGGPWAATTGTAAADLQVRWYEAPAVSLQGPVPPAEAWAYLQEDTAATAAVTRWRFDVEARTLCVALEEAAAAAPLERALQALLGPTWTLRVQHARPGWWLQPAPAWTDVQAWLLRQSASARGLALLSQLQPIAWQPAAARAAFRLPAAAARLAPPFARWVQHRLADRTGGAWAVDIAPGSDPAADCDGLRRALERSGTKTAWPPSAPSPIPAASSPRPSARTTDTPRRASSARRQGPAPTQAAAVATLKGQRDKRSR